MSVDAEKLLKTAFVEIERTVTANLVVGDPLHFGDKTIIPVVGMSIDFGGGGGSGAGKVTGENAVGEGANAGEGGGAGCGFTIKPVALIIIDEDEVRVEQLKIKHLKFEKLSTQSQYQPSSQSPCGESASKPEAAGSDQNLATEVEQLRRDVKELQIKLGMAESE